MIDFNFEELLYFLPGLIFGFSLHEFCHAFVAYKCGDETQKSFGRLTINPIKQIDPMGLLFIIFFKFGWAKPVQVNMRYLKKPKRDFFFISLAGPTANFLAGIGFSFIASIFTVSSWFNSTLINNSLILSARTVFIVASSMNFMLFIFNLLPFPGFDGYNAITAFLPSIVKEKLYRFEKFGFLLFIVLLMWGTPILILQNTVVWGLRDFFSGHSEKLLVIIFRLFT